MELNATMAAKREGVAAIANCRRKGAGTPGLPDRLGLSLDHRVVPAQVPQGGGALR